MKIYIQETCSHIAMTQSRRPGDIFDYIEMTKEVTPRRSQGINQDVSTLDYMNKVPTNKTAAKK